MCASAMHVKSLYGTLGRDYAGLPLRTEIEDAARDLDVPGFMRRRVKDFLRECWQGAAGIYAVESAKRREAEKDK